MTVEVVPAAPEHQAAHGILYCPCVFSGCVGLVQSDQVLKQELHLCRLTPRCSQAMWLRLAPASPQSRQRRQRQQTCQTAASSVLAQQVRPISNAHTAGYHCLLGGKQLQMCGLPDHPEHSGAC